MRLQIHLEIEWDESSDEDRVFYRNKLTYCSDGGLIARRAAAGAMASGSMVMEEEAAKIATDAAYWAEITMVTH